MFKMKSDKISFIATIDGLNEIDECLPKPAKHFIPQWFKDIPKTQPMSVRVCPSFPDYFSKGYILPMWSDVKLSYDGDNWKWTSPTNLITWDSHSNDQFLDYTQASFNGVDGQFVFKANCPWKIITPPGWSVLQLPLFYHFNKEYSILPGILDTDIYHDLNQQILYHGNGKEIIINRGDPFVLYIPFKRSNVLKSEIRHATKKDYQIFSNTVYGLFTKFKPNGYYRYLQRKRDKGV